MFPIGISQYLLNMCSEPLDLEQFADFLEIAIINLKETGYHNELGNGFFMVCCKQN